MHAFYHSATSHQDFGQGSIGSLCSGQPSFCKGTHSGPTQLDVSTFSLLMRLVNNFTESHGESVVRFDEVGVNRADVFVTESAETITHQKLKLGLCAINAERPLQYGEIAWMLPRDDIAFKAYVDQWLHLSQTGGEFELVMDGRLAEVEQSCQVASDRLASLYLCVRTTRVKLLRQFMLALLDLTRQSSDNM
jgi:hypothetical protein